MPTAHHRTRIAWLAEENRRQCAIVASADAKDRDLHDFPDETLLDLDENENDACEAEMLRLLQGGRL